MDSLRGVFYLDQACSQAIEVAQRVEPDPTDVSAYQRGYAEWRKLYPALRGMRGRDAEIIFRFGLSLLPGLWDLRPPKNGRHYAPEVQGRLAQHFSARKSAPKKT